MRAFVSSACGVLIAAAAAVRSDIYIYFFNIYIFRNIYFADNVGGGDSFGSRGGASQTGFQRSGLVPSEDRTNRSFGTCMVVLVAFTHSVFLSLSPPFPLSPSLPAKTKHAKSGHSL